MRTPSVRSLHPADKSFSERIFAAIYRARFAVPAIVIHMIVFLFVGSIVLFQVPAVLPDFEPPSRSFVMNEELPPAPPVDPPTVSQELPSAKPAVPNLQTNAHVITTTQPSFEVASLQPSFSPGKQLNNLLPFNNLEKLGGTATHHFGDSFKTQSALTGTFYDLKQTSDRRPSGVTNAQYAEVVQQFATNFRESLLDDYFRSPTSLYAGQIMIPDMPATEGPKAFGVERDVQPSRWLALYRAKVSPPASGVYHFVGAGDDVMLVRFNGKLVLDRCWYARSDWKPQANYDYHWTNIPKGFAKGNAMNVKAGQWYDIEVLIGEQPGGRMFATLLIEQEGVKYSSDSHGNPILPVFRVTDSPLPTLDRDQTLPPHQESGPVWKAVSSNASEFDRAFGPR